MYQYLVVHTLYYADTSNKRLYSGIPQYFLFLKRVLLFYTTFVSVLCRLALFCTSEKLWNPEYIHRNSLFGCLHRLHKNRQGCIFKFTAGMLPAVHLKIQPVYFCARDARSQKYELLFKVSFCFTRDGTRTWFHLA